VLSVNLMGDWLRDHLDPKLRQLGGSGTVPDAAVAGTVGPAVGGVPARSSAGDGG
jgi:hypothetical protein